MLTVVAVAVGIPVAVAMMVLALVSFLSRRTRNGRREGRYTPRPGNSADAGSTPGGIGGG